MKDKLATQLELIRWGVRMGLISQREANEVVD